MLMQPNENYLVIQEVLRKAFFLRDNKDWLYVSLVMFFFFQYTFHILLGLAKYGLASKNIY